MHASTFNQNSPKIKTLKLISPKIQQIKPKILLSYKIEMQKEKYVIFEP